MPYTREFVKDLHGRGITTITLVYDGAGDSGSITDVVPNIGSVISDDFDERFKELGYELLYQHFPGWELNEGSNGEIEITVNKDGTLSYNMSGYTGMKRGVV